MSINGVRTDGLTHSDAVELIQNSSSPLVLLMRQTAQSSDHATGNATTTGKRRNSNTVAPKTDIAVR